MSRRMVATATVECDAEIVAVQVYCGGDFGFMAQLAKYMPTNGPITFLDAGANIGMASLLFAQLIMGNGQVISVEANPETAQVQFRAGVSRQFSRGRPRRADSQVPAMLPTARPLPEPLLQTAQNSVTVMICYACSTCNLHLAYRNSLDVRNYNALRMWWQGLPSFKLRVQFCN